MELKMASVAPSIILVWMDYCKEYHGHKFTKPPCSMNQIFDKLPSQNLPFDKPLTQIAYFVSLTGSASQVQTNPYWFDNFLLAFCYGLGRASR
jgi:hypothetical protein